MALLSHSSSLKKGDDYLNLPFLPRTTAPMGTFLLSNLEEVIQILSQVPHL